MRINCLSEPAGGVERYIRETDEHLLQNGHEVMTVEINSTKKPGNSQLTEHIYVPGSSISRLFGDIIPDEEVFNFLNDSYKKINPDIIHIHHFRVSFMAVARFINSISTPCVYTAHDAQLVCPISTLVLPDGKICEGGIKTRCMFTGCRTGINVPYEMYRIKIFDRFVKNRISAYLCPSNAIKNYMETFGYTPSIFIRSFPNMNIDALDKLDFQKENTIGFLGRVDRYKGLQYLITALASVKKKIPDIQLKVAGEGDFLPSVKKLVDELDLSNNVTFLGYLPKESHRDFFASIKFLVIPSVMIENIIFTAQEAFAFGRTVIASSVGGIPEIIENDLNGELVPPADSSALFSKITSLLEDKEKLIRLSTEAFDSIKRILQERHYDTDITEIYENVINNKSLN